MRLVLQDSTSRVRSLCLLPVSYVRLTLPHLASPYKGEGRNRRVLLHSLPYPRNSRRGSVSPAR